MRLTKKDMTVLEHIVDREGACSFYVICQSCPFKGQCLPAFLKNKPRPSEIDRKNMALDALTRAVLLLESDD
jgi:hypothetical protein